MYIILGAFIGALASIIISWGFFFLSTVIPFLGFCNCCGCLWPFVGAAIGAAMAVRFSPKGGGAGTGALVGGLSGFMGGMVHSGIFFLGMASIVTMIPAFWPTLRQGINEKNITSVVKDIEDQQFKTDVTTLLTNMQKQEDFKDAYSELQVWLVPERIDYIVERMSKASKDKDPTEEEKEQLRKTLTDIRGLDFEDAMEKAKPIFQQAKLAMAGLLFVLSFIYSSFYAFVGLFGGLLGGALFTKESPAPPMQKEAF